MGLRVLTVIGWSLVGSVIGFVGAIFVMFANQMTLGSEENAPFWELLASILRVSPTTLIAFFGWLVLAGFVTAFAAIYAVLTFPYPGKDDFTKSGMALPVALALAGTILGFVVLPLGLADAAPDIVGWITKDAIGDWAFNLGSLLVAGLLAGVGALIGRAITGEVLARQARGAAIRSALLGAGVGDSTE